MSEYTERFRCKEALDKDRAIMQDQVAEFLSKGGAVRECTPSEGEVKEALAKKYRPLLSTKNNFKNIGLGEL